MTVAEMLIELGAPGRGASARLRWFADWLPDAEKRILSEHDLAHINACHLAAEPHELFAAVPALQKPVWFETATAERGMIRGCGAVPADDGIDIGSACFSDALGMVEPFGPARVTTTAMVQPDHLGDRSWRELRQAAGIVLRALLLAHRK
jgi:hypothetical protein